MKLYILFKVKDMSKKRKEFIIDNIYSTYKGAECRESRLHGFNNSHRCYMSCRNYLADGKPLLKTDTQQTYIIQKSLKGLVIARNRKSNHRICIWDPKLSYLVGSDE
jgi:hypothetical protein